MEQLKLITDAYGAVKWYGHLHLQLLIHFRILSKLNFQK
jgi:hypothetical protein